MGKMKPATHTVTVNRPSWYGGDMVDHPCRLTKDHVILVPNHGWKFRRDSGWLVGGGYLGPSLDLSTLCPLSESSR